MSDKTYVEYVDAIDVAAADAEVNVLLSMADVYEKQARILMECDAEDLPVFEAMFQEAEMQDMIDKANDLQKKSEPGILGKSSEPLVVRLLLIIPRLIKALFQRIKAFFKSNNSEQRKMEKALTEVKRASEQPVPTQSSTSKNQTSSANSKQSSVSEKQTSYKDYISDSEKKSSSKSAVKIKQYRFKDLLLAGGGDFVFTGKDQLSKLHHVEAALSDRVPKVIDMITKACDICKEVADSGQDVTKEQIDKMAEVTKAAGLELTDFRISVTDDMIPILRSHMNKHGYSDPFNGRSTYNNKFGDQTVDFVYWPAKHSDRNDVLTGIKSGNSPYILQLPNDISTNERQKIEADIKSDKDQITVEEAIQRLQQYAAINTSMVMLFGKLSGVVPDVRIASYRVNDVKNNSRGNTRRQGSANDADPKAPKNIDLNDATVRCAFRRANRFFDKATKVCDQAFEITTRLHTIFYREKQMIMDAINFYKRTDIDDPKFHRTQTVQQWK